MRLAELFDLFMLCSGAIVQLKSLLRLSVLQLAMKRCCWDPLWDDDGVFCPKLPSDVLPCDVLPNQERSDPRALPVVLSERAEDGSETEASVGEAGLFAESKELDQFAYSASSAALLSKPVRCLAALFSLVPLVLLGITFYLQPDQEGLGTHQQLGLPPCSMRVVFGIRCPACGMTTSWAHFVRGQWLQSTVANPAGFLLAIYSLAFTAGAFVVAKRGRFPAIWVQNTMIACLASIAIIAVVNWLGRFVFN